MIKVGRNDPCSCGSGQKYKYCCIGFSKKDRKANATFPLMDAKTTKNFKKSSDKESAEHERLRHFCKDHGFYYFRNRNEEDYLNIQRKLSDRSLVKEDFISSYRKHTTKELVSFLLNIAHKQSNAFAQRKLILSSAVDAHFSGQHELSIPAFFVVIEGVLRDIGGLNLKDKFKPTMKSNGLEEQILYTVVDSLKYFNAFVSNLFKGSQEAGEFNRNTILHGANNSSFNEENSLILLLTILEIQDYIFYQNSWPPQLEVRNGVRILTFPNT
tara:strand:- start:138 stop:947 length:810 start_codon:yes stop_codon:yes gene_type:complete